LGKFLGSKTVEIIARRREMQRKPINFKQKAWRVEALLLAPETRAILFSSKKHAQDFTKNKNVVAAGRITLVEVSVTEILPKRRKK